MNPVTVPSKATPLQPVILAPTAKPAAKPAAKPKAKAKAAQVIRVRPRSRSGAREPVPNYHDTPPGKWHPPLAIWTVKMAQGLIDPCPTNDCTITAWSSNYFECVCCGAATRCTHCHLKMREGCKFRDHPCCVHCAYKVLTPTRFRQFADISQFCYDEQVRKLFDEMVRPS